MPEATNTQMQTYCDQRLRVRAETIRNAVAAIRDDKAAIDDVYARAAGTNIWNDARTDGPPHLLAAGGAANPNDVTNYNAWMVALLTILDGTNTAQDAANAATLRANYATFMRACVRPEGG